MGDPHEPSDRGPRDRRGARAPATEGQRPRSARRAWPSRRALGRHGERLAEAYLRAQGFRILVRNLVLPSGELDLVAWDRGALVFVEVRTRSGPHFGSPEESVTASKRRRLVRLAREALAQRRWPSHRSMRFDVVAIDASHEPPSVRLVRDAFYLDRS